MVTDTHALPMASEVLFESSAFCYAIVILKSNKGKNEQHLLRRLVICFQYYTPHWCVLPSGLYGKKQRIEWEYFCASPLETKGDKKQWELQFSARSNSTYNLDISMQQGFRFILRRLGFSLRDTISTPCINNKKRTGSLTWRFMLTT